MTFGYDPVVGRKVAISNNYNDIKSLLDVGHEIDTVAGWLELDSEAYGSNTCLFDITQCDEGISLEFWLKVYNCETEVSIALL